MTGGSRSTRLARNSLLALRAAHTNLVPVDNPTSTFQLIWVRPDPEAPSHLVAVPADPEQKWPDFEVVGVSAAMLTGSQDLIGYAGFLIESGWTITRFGLRTGASINSGSRALREDAYNTILLDDLAAGGPDEVEQTLYAELRCVYVESIRARRGADTLTLDRGGRLTVGDPQPFVDLLNARTPPNQRRIPRTPVVPRVSLWSRLTRKVAR